MEIIKMNRLIADEGKVLTNGKRIAPVVDCFESDVSKWSEIDEPSEDEAVV